MLDVPTLSVGRITGFHPEMLSYASDNTILKGETTVISFRKLSIASKVFGWCAILLVASLAASGLLLRQLTSYDKQVSTRVSQQDPARQLQVTFKKQV